MMFAGMTIVLATVGIYGVVGSSIIRRRREIAIRISLGAKRRNIILLVTAAIASSTIAGIMIGTLTTIALARVLRTFLFGATPLAPTAYVLSITGIATLALIACLVPTATIFRLNPQDILKE
jgi:putative ABC transport system permease protein